MKEREPTSTTEPLEVEIEGEVHRGERVLLTVSDGEVRQEIRFQDLRQVDPIPYPLSDSVFMRNIAKVILRDLIEQWRAQGARKPVKVGPRRRSRRRRGGA